MDSVTIFRQITVKQIVTEKSKRDTLEQIKEEIIRLTEEQAAFEEDKTKLLTEASLKGADQAQLEKFRKHFETDGARFRVRQDELRERSEEISKLVVGEEIVGGTVEGPYEVRVGQSLNDALATEIVVKDGIIVEIRP